MAKASKGLKEKLSQAHSKEERAEILDGLPHVVGFGKPPVDSQFKTGNTRGRNGRPKGSKNPHTIIEEEFNRKVEVTEAGKKHQIETLRVVARQLSIKAASGDLRAIAIYFDIHRKLGEPAPEQEPQGSVLDERDLEAVNQVAKMLDEAEV